MNNPEQPAIDDDLALSELQAALRNARSRLEKCDNGCEMAELNLAIATLQQDITARRIWLRSRGRRRCGDAARPNRLYIEFGAYENGEWDISASEPGQGEEYIRASIAEHSVSEWKRLYEQQREYAGSLPVKLETLMATHDALLASLEEIVGMIPMGGVGSRQWHAAIKQAKVNIAKAKGE